MKAVVQHAKFSRHAKSPLLEKEFLKLYSKWHETHDHTLERKMFMSIERLLRHEPSFDFREQLWRAL